MSEFEKAKNLYFEGKYAQAYKALMLLVDTNLSNEEKMDVWLWCGHCSYIMDMAQRAEQEYTKALHIAKEIGSANGQVNILEG